MEAMAIRDVVKDSVSSHGDLASVLPAGTPAPTPTPPPTISPAPTTCDLIVVNILTDKYPGETSWSIVNKCTGKEIQRVNGYGSKSTDKKWESECINQGNYEFTIKDSWGDGICCGYGRGSVSVSYNGKEYPHKGDFGEEWTKTFGSCEPVTPSPTESPTHEPTGTPTSPTPKPTGNPTRSPTKIPTSNPTESPTSHPTTNPSDSPTKSPTNNPTESPTNNPTESPTSNPTESPTHSAAYNLGYSAGFADGFAEAEAGQE